MTPVSFPYPDIWFKCPFHFTPSWYPWSRPASAQSLGDCGRLGSHKQEDGMGKHWESSPINHCLYSFQPALTRCKVLLALLVECILYVPTITHTHIHTHSRSVDWNDAGESAPYGVRTSGKWNLQARLSSCLLHTENYSATIPFWFLPNSFSIISSQSLQAYVLLHSMRTIHDP